MIAFELHRSNSLTAMLQTIVTVWNVEGAVLSFMKTSLSRSLGMSEVFLIIKLHHSTETKVREHPSARYLTVAI